MQNKVTAVFNAREEEACRVAVQGVSVLQLLCHGASRKAGWWQDLNTGVALDPNKEFGGKVALIHSEISEALEGHRKNQMDDHLPHRKMVEVEFADAIIRILDLAGALKLDVAGAIIEKLDYNSKRKDHKLANRLLADGKKF